MNLKQITGWLAQRKKAIAGFVAPGVVLLFGDVVHDHAAPTHNEWLAIGSVCVLTALGVHVAPKNKPKP